MATELMTMRKCDCGHQGCDQYILNAQMTAGFTKEDAEKICQSYNSHDALVAALDAMLKKYGGMYDEWNEAERNATAALRLARSKGLENG